MPTIRLGTGVCLFLLGTIFLSMAAPEAVGHPRWTESNPCQTGAASPGTLPEHGPPPEHGLTPEDRESVVYDSNQSICWLADANLAGNAYFRAKLGVAGINPDGTMDYATALNWVQALNNYNQGQGYLGHNNWQLPVTPLNDSSCSSVNNGNFGASCTGSALGNLYYSGLGRRFPDSVVPHLSTSVAPFVNLQPSLYWTTDQNSGGEVTFSFNTGLGGSNTTKYNFFRLLPMSLSPIGTPPTGTGVIPYTTGAAAGKAVYDMKTGISWVLDGNLAASNNFGVTGTTTIAPDVKTSATLTVPLIDADGAMLFATAANAGGWLDAMNKSNYAAMNNWQLPRIADLQNLYKNLNLQPGDTRLEAHVRLGLFQNLQPGFYWACERDANGTSHSPCDPNLSPAAGFAYSFNFDNGFEGTDLLSKQFYVMVYYPAPGAH